MKDLRPALRALMLSHPPVAAAVTSGGVARIYPAVLPQGILLPSIVQTQVSEASDYHLRGPSGLGTARVQVDCWAQTSDLAVSLANDVRDKLAGFAGAVSWGSSSPQEQLAFRGIFVEMGGDEYDDLAKLFSRRRDYLIWYAERDAAVQPSVVGEF